MVWRMGWRLLSRTSPPHDIFVRALGNFQSALGLRGMLMAEQTFMQRHRNGMALMQRLSGIAGIRLPHIASNSFAVFNRFPVIVEDINRVAYVQNKLWQNGIESSRMYERPLHHMFELGYGRNDFPNARFLAQRLLTLPVHPGVTRRHIGIMIDALREMK